MDDAERRRLVFTNLVNGVAVPAVMAAFHMSEAEVMADFDFVTAKLRSYRLERMLAIVPCGTIAEARNHRFDNLWILARVNLAKPATYRRIEFVDYDGRGGPGQQLLDHINAKRATTP